jgi:hypothetical protein
MIAVFLRDFSLSANPVQAAGLGRPEAGKSFAINGAWVRWVAVCDRLVLTLEADLSRHEG